jgi:DNA-binding NarL/FixJ family response regulator
MGNKRDMNTLQLPSAILPAKAHTTAHQRDSRRAAEWFGGHPVDPLHLPAKQINIVVEYGDDIYVEHAITIKVAGSLAEQNSAAVLTGSVREAHKTKNFFNAGIVRRLPEKPKPGNGRATSETQIGELTSREMEVLQLIAEGKANKETASKLCISTKTVEKHREHIREKLGIHGTANLTRYAIAAGIVQCNPKLDAEQEQGEKPRNSLSSTP